MVSSQVRAICQAGILPGRNLKTRYFGDSNCPDTYFLNLRDTILDCVGSFHYITFSGVSGVSRQYLAWLIRWKYYMGWSSYSAC